MTTPDEGVREIQLSGKQLVFLFMAVTVVSVVIFLCGVLVGRGVQATRGSEMVDAPAMTEAAPSGDVSAPVPEPVPDAPTPAADVTFPDRLQKNDPPKETLVPRKEGARPPTAAAPTTAGAAPSTPAPAPAASSTPVRAANAEPAKTAPKADPAAPSPGVPTEPRGNGFAVQVAALNARGEAEVIVKRLAGKGYAAYLVAPLAGQPPVFRVRIGKFRERAEAEKVAARLEREEQFKPWITR
jgi:DedD protein